MPQGIMGETQTRISSSLRSLTFDVWKILAVVSSDMFEKMKGSCFVASQELWKGTNVYRMALEFIVTQCRGILDPVAH